MHLPWVRVDAVSKTALSVPGETLRLERLLASVKVLAEPLLRKCRPSITIRSGVTLPADSRHHPLPEHIEKQAQTKKDKYLLVHLGAS